MRKFRVVTTPLAQEYIDDHAIYIASENLEAGLRFLDAMDHVRSELVRLPMIGMNRGFDSDVLSGLRDWPVPGFENWLIFYRVADDTVTVIRVLHGARDLQSALGE